MYDAVQKKLLDPPQEPHSEIICTPTYRGGGTHNSV